MDQGVIVTVAETLHYIYPMAESSLSSSDVGTMSV